MTIDRTKLDPARLDDAVIILDDYLGPDPVPPPRHVFDAWRTVRGEARRGRRISSQAIPHLGLVAQHQTAAREHISKANEILGQAFPTPTSDPPPPTEPAPPPERKP